MRGGTKIVHVRNGGCRKLNFYFFQHVFIVVLNFSSTDEKRSFVKKIPRASASEAPDRTSVISWFQAGRRLKIGFKPNLLFNPLC